MTVTMDNNSGLNKLRAASCSVLLLLLTLALVASSLLVARYAVAASSWWLSLLAITVCLLGLCTWIQLAASRAGRASRWRIMLARQMALSRAQRTVGGALAPDLYGTGDHNAASGWESRGAGPRGHPHVAIIPLECELDAQVPYRVPGPPPPPPYALSDLPPSYCAASPRAPAGEGAAPAASTAPAAPAASTAPAPPPGTEQPPPYAVAIKRDHLVQGATVHGDAATPTAPPAAPAVRSNNNNNITNTNTPTGGRSSRSARGRSRVVLWY